VTSLYCRSCSIHWGHAQAYFVCPICTEDTVFQPFGVPNFRAVLESRASEVEGFSFPVAFNVRAEPLEGDPNVLVVSSLRLNENGFGAVLRPETIVQLIDGDHVEYVEIIGYIDSERAYLVRLFAVRPPDYVPKDWKKRRKKKP